MDRWMAAQRISVASFCLRQFSQSVEWYDKLEQVFVSEMNRYLEGFEDEMHKRLQTLPLSTLHLLRRVPDLDGTCDVASLAAAVEEALNCLAFDKDKAVVPRCNVFTHHMLHGAADAKAIVAIAEDLFAIPREGRIRIGSPEMGRLENLLSELRFSDHPTEKRLPIVAQLVELLALRPIEHAQVQNTLLHHLFCWPLLVFERSELDVAVSVPVAVDARFDTENKAWRSSAKSIGENAYVLGATRIKLETPIPERRSFASYLAESVKVGRELWQSTHGHTGRDWRATVSTVPIVIDFGYASRAVDGILGHLGLDDGSAGAYFAQVTLARLLGRDSYLSSAITGIIGEQVLHPDGNPALNYKMRTPEDVQQKLQYVFESQMFERVVIPKDGELEHSISLAYQTAEVLQAANLSSVADIVQVLGWRKTHYVRCPDVAWVVHGPKDRSGRPLDVEPQDETDFNRVRAALAKNDAPIIRLSDISPRAIASYLWYFNREVLQQLDRIPPSLSWAFIRAAADYEQDASFWQILWTISGASEEEFELFRHSPTTEAATNTLTRILNTFEPNKDARSHRAPDVLVIIGAERLEEKFQQQHTPAQRPLAVPAVLDRLSRTGGGLSPGPVRSQSDDYPQFHDWIGRTRIILLSDEQRSIYPQSMDMQINEEDARVLQLLCTFDWTFTQNTAALVLSELESNGKPFKGMQVRKKLEDLRNRNLLKYVIGEYFVPENVKHALESKLKQGYSNRQLEEVLARRHFAIGSALAPYWTVSEYPGLAYDTAFIPERVHEAQHHFDEAGKRFGNIDNKAGIKAAQEGRTRVMRFGRTVDWGTAYTLAKLKSSPLCKVAYLFAVEFMERWLKHPSNGGTVPNHPAHLACAAKALRYVQFGRDEERTIAERDWRGASQPEAICNLFEQALEACSAFNEEEEYNRLFVLSEYWEYLETRGSTKQDRLDQVNNEIVLMKPAWASCPNALRGSWFDVSADNCCDHRQAALIYAEGAKYTQGYQQLKVKCAGALCIERMEHQLLDDLRNLPKLDNEEAALAVLRGAKAGRMKDNYSNPRKKAYVFQRWSAGLSFIRDAWKRYPKCAEMLTTLNEF